MQALLYDSDTGPGRNLPGVTDCLSSRYFQRQSQPMSQFKANLKARMEALGLTPTSITAELNARGIQVAYSTVAGWLNSSRGQRWKVEELRALLDVLQTDLAAMAGDEAELVEAPVPAAVAREMRDLTPAQQQAILATVKSMKGDS